MFTSDSEESDDGGANDSVAVRRQPVSQVWERQPVLVGERQPVPQVPAVYLHCDGKNSNRWYDPNASDFSTTSEDED